MSDTKNDVQLKHDRYSLKTNNIQLIELEIELID